MFKTVLQGIKDRVEGTLAVSLIGLDGIAIDSIRADSVPLFGFLPVPPALHRRLARGHGFTRREIETAVEPLVARTAFGALHVERCGSTFRLELRK